MIRSGAWADLLLVEGDPLADIQVLARPDTALMTIIKDGTIVKHLADPA